MTSPSRPPFTMSPKGRRMLRNTFRATALLGFVLGIEAALVHIGLDPFIDTRRFYDAGARLNAGLPLYTPGPGVSPDAFLTFMNPPLLAIVFRPIALLPFPVAVVIWQAILLGACVLTLRRIGIREPVLIAIGYVGPAIAWALTVGQSEPLVLYLLSWGSPAAVAVAGQLKLLPLLVGVYWIVRRDVRSIVVCAAWSVGLGLFQLVLAPDATIAFLRLEWLNGAMDVNTISPYRISPLLWVAMAIVLLAIAIRTARTRFGWASAVAFAVLVHPRLLVYQLMTLLAAFGGPRYAADNPVAGPVPTSGRDSDASMIPAANSGSG